MDEPFLLLTGFGPFLDVGLNPSGELARALDGARFGGVVVRSIVLPVAFERVAPTYRAALAESAPGRPVALLSLGVHREGWFRLEERARPVLVSSKPDADGVLAAQVAALGDAELRTALDLDALGAALARGGAVDVRRSDDAGGYVCERTFYEVLERGAELGIPGCFLHVPPAAEVPVADQRGPVEALLEELVRQARAAQ